MMVMMMKGVAYKFVNSNENNNKKFIQLFKRASKNDDDHDVFPTCSFHNSNIKRSSKQFSPSFSP
jgi:hypothetical protein